MSNAELNKYAIAILFIKIFLFCKNQDMILLKTRKRKWGVVKKKQDNRKMFGVPLFDMNEFMLKWNIQTGNNLRKMSRNKRIVFVNKNVFSVNETGRICILAIKQEEVAERHRFGSEMYRTIVDGKLKWIETSEPKTQLYVETVTFRRNDLYVTNQLMLPHWLH